MDELEFQAQFRPAAAGSVAEVLTRRLATPDRDELAEDAAAKAAADARAREREELLLANRASGDPIGMVTRCQAAVSELRGEVLDLEGQLEAARARLNRAASNLVHWSDAAEEVRTAVARRSDPDDLLGPAKAAHAEYVAASRAAVAAMQAGTPRTARRPKGPGGYVARSEPVTCPDCLKVGATPEEAFAIHHPELLPPIDAVEEQAGQAERHGYEVVERWPVSYDGHGLAVR